MLYNLKYRLLYKMNSRQDIKGRVCHVCREVCKDRDGKRVRLPHTPRYCSVCGKWYCGVCKISRMKKRTGDYKCVACVGKPHI